MAAGRLNWLGKNPAWSKGLVDAVNGRRVFLTIRHGGKEALAFVPGDIVWICIDDTRIGQAKILALHRGPLGYFKTYYRSLLERNIGAKDWDQVFYDMREVYGRDMIGEDSIVSIIEMKGLS